MLLIADRMDAAMTSQGFIRKKARWRRESSLLPIVVSQEQAKTGGPRYGFTVLYGYPHRDPDEWGCFSISQGKACHLGGHYYDVSTASGREWIEEDFLAFTAPVAGRFEAADDLAGALIRGEIPSSQPGRGPTGLVRDLLDIAGAHGLDHIREHALELGRTLDSSPENREQIRDLARFRPEVADAIGWQPTPPKPARSRKRWHWR